MSFYSVFLIFIVIILIIIFIVVDSFFYKKVRSKVMSQSFFKNTPF